MYALEPSDERWLDAVVERLETELHGGFGIFAYTFDARDLASVQASGFAVRGTSAELEAIGRQFIGAAPPELSALLYPRVPQLFVGSKDLGLVPPPFAELGIGDVLGLIGAAGNGLGAVIGAHHRTLCRPRPRVAASWQRLAVHLATAYRLRSELLHSPGTPLDEAEAVLSPDGSLEHATSAAKPASAREALRRAARSMDRARGKLRSDDTDAALELWRALVDGRWTLLDHFDSDGRRFLIAVKNPPAVAAQRGLTARERQVVAYVAGGHSNKLIAYELGVSQGSVAEAIANALSKLGLQSRAELARLMRGAPASP